MNRPVAYYLYVQRNDLKSPTGHGFTGSTASISPFTVKSTLAHHCLMYSYTGKNMITRFPNNRCELKHCSVYMSGQIKPLAWIIFHK